MKIKATVYQLMISNSLFESIHGQNFYINEIFIQTHNTAYFMNKEFIGELTDKKRYVNAKKVKEIEIDEFDLERIKDIVDARQILEGLTEELHEKHEKIFVIPTQERCHKCNHIISKLTKEIRDDNSKKGKSVNACLKCKNGFYSQEDILV